MEIDIKKPYYFIERNRTGLYEPLLQENEREAIAELLQFLESVYIFLVSFL